VDLDIISKLQLPKIDLPQIEWPRFDISSLRSSTLPRLKIGDSVARLPIIQGGMGVGISLSGLASAVANEGGIGVIAANSIGIIDPDEGTRPKDASVIALRREIRKARNKTSGIIGVNIMVAVNDFNELLRVVIEEKADVAFLGAGLPIKGIPIEDLRSAGVKIVPIVSSARAARLIFKSWAKRYQDIPDGVVVEGPKAGGHLGFKETQIDDPDFALERVVPETVAELKTYEKEFGRTIPVIAAGGIYTGADIYDFFKLGASGVQMGTRFVGTHECDAHIRFKEAYIACKEDDIAIIKSPVGMPGRAIVNQFLNDVPSEERAGLKCKWKCLKSCDIKTAPYCISLALDNARKGILEKGFAFAGSNAYRVNKIISVKELLLELKKEYQCSEEKGADNLSFEYERALERLAVLKEEYLTTLNNGLSGLKKAYVREVEKHSVAFQEEYSKISNRIVALKTEYSRALDRATILKEELAALFEQYAAFNMVCEEV